MGITLENVLWPMCIGILGASVVILIYKKIFGRFVARLIELGATSPETAVTFTETGIKPSVFLVNALRGKGSFSRLILSLPDKTQASPASESDGAAQQAKNSPLQLRYYLPEENQDRVSLQYNNNGASVLCVFLAFILFFGITLLLIKVVPEIVQLLKNVFDML